mmetsp:Transcript_9879/g.21098  ORF Transcript_9879/g.21098 Transcript_9879/m.21098 type:complete len:251 (+) Transcript_9879:483-1235(+)
MRSVQRSRMGVSLFSSVHLSTSGMSFSLRRRRKASTRKRGSSRLISAMHSDISVSNSRSPSRFDASLKLKTASSVPEMSGPRTATSLSFRTVRSHRVSGRTITPVVEVSMALPSTGPVSRGSSPSASRTFLATFEEEILSSIALDFLSITSCTSKIVSAAFMPISAVPRTSGLSTTFFAMSPTTRIPPPIFSLVGLVCSSTLSACFFASSAAFWAISMLLRAASSASIFACCSRSIASFIFSSSAVFRVN